MGAAGARAPVGVADLGMVLGRVPLGGGAERAQTAPRWLRLTADGGCGWLRLTAGEGYR